MEKKLWTGLEVASGTEIDAPISKMRFDIYQKYLSFMALSEDSSRWAKLLRLRYP